MAPRPGRHVHYLLPQRFPGSRLDLSRRAKATRRVRGDPNQRNGSVYEAATPMRRIRPPCCARAASGHAAVPPSAARSCRRLIRSPHQRAAVSMGVWQGRAPWRSCGSRPSRILSGVAPEIARLLPAQDAINIGGGATDEIYDVGSVGEQIALSDKDRLLIDR